MPGQRIAPVVLLCLLSAACSGPSKPIGSVGHVEGFAGMVAADEPNAVLVGRDVLSAGGSPADAAVAMAFTLAVTLPSQAGLGAGGVCLVYDHDQKKTEALDFIPPPPVELLPETTRPSAVPAMPRGMYALHAKYGKLRWEQLLAPSETMARLGTPVSRALAQQLVPVSGALFEDAEARRVFARPDGQPLAEGDKMVQMDVGAILSRFRSRGVGEFYNGPWAAEIVSSVRAAGGSLTTEELRGFVPQWKEALPVSYDNDTAYFAPPPAAAGLFEAQLWAALARDGAYDDAARDARPHLLAEAYSHTFADRARWMNPEGTANQASDVLTSKPYLKSLLAGYSADRHQALQGDAPSDVVAGTGFVAMDANGSAVACNLSLNNAFGTGRMAPRTGFLLAAATSYKGRGPYGLGPMLAVNVNSNEFRYAAAAGGGPTAPTAMIEVALDTLVEDRPLQDAIGAKRLHASHAPDTVFVEPGYPWTGALQARNHHVQETDMPSRVNAIRCVSGSPNTSRCSVATDPRGYGMATVSGSN